MEEEQVRFIRLTHSLLVHCKKARRLPTLCGIFFLVTFGVGTILDIRDFRFRPAIGFFFIVLPALYYLSIHPLILLVEVERFLGRFREGPPSMDQFVEEERALAAFIEKWKQWGRIGYGVGLAVYGIGFYLGAKPSYQWIGICLLIIGPMLSIALHRSVLPTSRQPSNSFDPPTPWAPDRDD